MTLTRVEKSVAMVKPPARMAGFVVLSVYYVQLYYPHLMETA
jgi:hypothetical protein